MFSILLFYYLQGIAPAFIMTLILGSYTDSGGRKKILYFPIIGNLIRVAIILFIVNFEWPVDTIVISSFIAGAFGGTQTLFTVCYSYIADITNEEKRSFRWVSVYWSNGRFLCPVMTILKYIDGLIPSGEGKRKVGDCNQETSFILVGISRKYLWEHSKLTMLWIFHEMQPSPFNAGLTIDLCCVPLVCAL